MKTRRQVIDEIIQESHKQPQWVQDKVMKMGLLEMQDALIFMLAKDLGISLEINGVLS
jgi:hypothetical protein